MSLNIGIVLAAGSGRRMEADKKKQFMELGGRHLMCYSLKAMEDSPLIDHIIVVTSQSDVELVRDELLPPYGFTKIRKVVGGGDYRCLSVWEGLKACRQELPVDKKGDKAYIFIQDGARPFLTGDIIERNYKAVARTGACVTAMPSQDTVRMSLGTDPTPWGTDPTPGGTDPSPRSWTDPVYAGKTIPRDRVWLMQTPQTFSLDLAWEAFKVLPGKSRQELNAITDDVMVVTAHDPHIRVELVQGSKNNIKVTTREDIPLAEFLIYEKYKDPDNN